MARKIDATQVEPLLECGICLEEYNDPRSLPCLHSICLECLKSYVATRKAPDGTFPCPNCRLRSTVPGGKVGNFLKNFFVNSLKDIMPASVIQQLQSLSSMASIPIPCKNIKDGIYTHGEATIYCVQCDASFCDHCSQSHRLFDAMKGHSLIPVHDRLPNCDRHIKPKLTHFCRTCILPAFTECINDDHEGHILADISDIAKEFKQEMQTVSQMAAKRIEFLQEMCSDLNKIKVKIEHDFDKASRDITEAAVDLCSLIRQLENSLQTKLKKARETTKEFITKAKMELENCKESTSCLKLSLENPTAGAVPLCTVLQAPIIKQQLLNQQHIPMPFVQCIINRTQEKSPTFNDVGDIDIQIAVKQQHVMNINNGTFGKPVQTTKLDFMGEWAVCGIATVHNTAICVAHLTEACIWVYSDAGQLKKRIKVADIHNIFGIVATDSNEGKLAIVDGSERKIHCVTLSLDFEVLQHTTIDVPIVPDRISIGHNKQLILSSIGEKRVVVLSGDGEELSNIVIPIPHVDVFISCVAQTKSGFVICDRENKKVYFTEADGHIHHTSTHCVDPRHAVYTSWGHVLFADHTGDEIKTCSEDGQPLGDVHDINGTITHPRSVHVDEAERRVYVACGYTGNHQLRTYAFVPNNLPSLSVKQSVANVAVAVKLAKV